mmetsp:Transcript_74045/g.239385  ORF Transcript_74045/g.239385 Transcript_74045/m.239385 type:complete len:207 (+) Transcript_74045:244-864(+)
MSMRPLAAASWNSPRSTVCARLSQTRRSAAATKVGSSSCFPGTSAPMAFTCTPPAGSHSRMRTGARAAVTVWISWHRAASSAAGAAETSQPSARMSSQKRAARAGSRVCTSTRRQGVTDFRKRSCHRACTPAPKIPISLSASPRGARTRAASAAAAAVRISVRSPSSKKMASSRVVRWLSSRFRPVFTGKPRASFSRTPPGAILMT